MGIEVRHDGGMPSILAAIQLALAQKQQQDQQQPQPSQQPQQNGPPNAIAQLAQILAAKQAGQQAQQPASYANPGNLPSPPPPSGPQYVRPTVVQQPADHSSSLARGLLNGQQADDRLNNQDALAQFRAQQSDQRLGERNDQQTQLQQLRDADTLAREQQHDLPQYLVQGLQAGHLAYSPVQNDQLTKFDTWDAQIEASPQFSPEQKAHAHADIAVKRRQVQMSPTPVSPDKWPVTPEQQLAQQTVMKPVVIDPNTTLQLPMVPVQRAGGVKWELTPDGEAAKAVALQNLKHQQTLEAQNQKHQQALEIEHIKNANKPNRDEALQAAYVKQQRDVALKALGKEPTPRDADFKDDSFTGFDKDAFDKAHADWAAKRDAALRQYPVEDQFAPLIGRQTQQLHDLGQQLGGLSMLPLPGGPPVTGMSSTGDSQPPDQQSQGADAGPQEMPPPAPTLSDHPEDGKAQWDSTPAGAVVTLPDGRTVRKTGDTSFEPVQ